MLGHGLRQLLGKKFRHGLFLGQDPAQLGDDVGFAKLLGGLDQSRLLSAGRRRARVAVAAGALLCSVPLLAVAFVLTQPFLAPVVLSVGVAFLAAVNPALDAARLDIMPAALWGRAESVRTVFRSSAEAAAPTSFGLVADRLFGGNMAPTFLIFVGALLIAGIFALLGMRTYLTDVRAAAATSDRDRPRRVSDPAPPGRHRRVLALRPLCPRVCCDYGVRRRCPVSPSQDRRTAA